LLKIAHLSDLHFSKVTYHPSQFFSKRWLGNLNLIFSRRKGHSVAQLDEIANILIKEKADIAFITGDLSTTSRPEEFEGAKRWIDGLKKAGIKTIVLPGNHDHYTKSSYKKKLFYDYFINEDFPYLLPDQARSLKSEKIEAVKLSDHWQCISLDAVIPTSLWASTGLFSKEMEKALLSALEKLPSDKNTIILCHFPYFCTDTLRKQLIGRERLKKILEDYPIKLYLHGHTHNQTLASLYPELPNTLDSGSSSHVKDGSFHLMELQEDRASVTVYVHRSKSWQIEKKANFSFEELD